MKNLKLILAAEIVLIVLLCIVVAGAFLYFGGLRSAPAVSNPSAVAPTSAPAISTDVPVIPVETPTAAAPGMTGTAVEKLPDGTTKYTDYDAGFELILPAGWLGVRPDTEEFNTTLANEGAKNEMLRDQMSTDMSGYEAGFDRLYSYPLRPDIQKDVIFGFSKLGWDSDDPKPIDNDSLGDLVRGLETSGTIPGFRVTFSNLIENGNKVSIIVVKGRFSLDDGQGGLTPFVATLLFFKPSSTSTTRVTFTVVQDYDEQISPDIDSITESIKLLGQ